MDILTQAVLGSALSQSGSRSSETRLATWIGLAAGLLADADVFIRSSEDTLLSIEYHRHFTHSIFFIPFGALIAALILWPFIKNKISFKRLYWFALLGYSLSGVIDACTSYGTYLFWPLYDERISFHLIAIVDPVFTLALIVGVVIAYKKRQSRFALMGLLFAAAYLSVSFVQLQRAEAVAEQLAIERGHAPLRSLTKPTIGNILLWRSIYEYDGRIYVDAIRAGLETRVYPGSSVLLFKPERDASAIPRDSVLYNDFFRFSEFSEGYISVHPLNDKIIGDVRYSIQADGVVPLWGIDFDYAQPQNHAVFRMYHQHNQSHIDRFMAMLMNKDVE